jgi:hypothetical protein
MKPTSTVMIDQVIYRSVVAIELSNLSQYTIHGPIVYKHNENMNIFPPGKSVCSILDMIFLDESCSCSIVKPPTKAYRM